MTDNPEISEGGADDAPSLYPYAGIPLSPNGISALILELFAGKTVERQEIVDLVLRTHLERGGAQPRAADFPRSVKKALENLKRNKLYQTLHSDSGKFRQANPEKRMRSLIP